MARRQLVCIGRGWIGGYHGHEEDIRPSEGWPSWLKGVPLRKGDGYCRKCRSAAAARARWTGVKQMHRGPNQRPM